MHQKEKKKKTRKQKKEKEYPINEFKINNEKEMNNNEEEIKKGIENEVNTKRQNYLLSMEVMSYIEKIFLNDSGLVSLLFGNI